MCLAFSDISLCLVGVTQRSCASYQEVDPCNFRLVVRISHPSLTCLNYWLAILTRWHLQRGIFTLTLETDPLAQLFPFSCLKINAFATLPINYINFI